MKTTKIKDNSHEPGSQAIPAKALKCLYVPCQHESTDEWKIAPGTARTFHAPRGPKASDELVPEAERTKSTIYWLPNDADSKNWNLECQYLCARIAFCTAKEAE